MTRGESGWLLLLSAGLPPAVLRQLAWRTPAWSLSRPRRPFGVEVLQTMSLPPPSAPTVTGWSDSCRAGFAPAEEQRLFTAHCSASTTFAGRVASSEDVTGLPQDDRTDGVPAASDEFPTERFILSPVGQELAGACAEPPSRPSAPRSGGGAQRRALTAVSTGAGCRYPTGASSGTQLAAAEVAPPCVASL